MSPKKKIKQSIVSNNGKEVDKSITKDKLRNRSKIDEKVLDLNLSSGETTEEELSDLSDDNEHEFVENFKFGNKSNINDNYFMGQSVRRKTSNNMFSKVMQNFDLNESQIEEIIEKQLIPKRKGLIDSYINDNYFDKWINLMKCGFNALLYGLGSKRKLIDLFVSNCLQSEHHIVIEGYSSEMSVKNLTSVLSQPLNETINDEIKLIERLREIDLEMFLVIHSIDILCANNVKIKSFLYHLMSKCKSLHMIASVDHINSGLIWSTTESHAYNWLWFNVCTFESYSIEKAFTTSLSINSSSSKSWTQSLTLSSIKNVYNSLNSNAQKIFTIILNHYINNNETNSGFPFSDCYTLCREEFLVNSEMTLRAQISEFKDHNILKLKKGIEGEVIHVSIDKTIAQKFVENL